MNSEDISRLIEQRLTQAEEALRDSEILLSAGSGYRTVVNRCYYAMFYSVLALLQTIGKVPRKHQGTISLFDSEFVKKGILSQELSESLHRSFEQRQKYDYRIPSPVSKEDADEALAESRIFIEEVRSYLMQAGFLKDE